MVPSPSKAKDAIDPDQGSSSGKERLEAASVAPQQTSASVKDQLDEVLAKNAALREEKDVLERRTQQLENELARSKASYSHLAVLKAQGEEVLSALGAGSQRKPPPTKEGSL